MRTHRVVSVLTVSLVCGACASADSDPSWEPLGEALSATTASAAWKLRDDVDDWIDQTLPRWDVYVAGPSKHYVHPGIWEYYSSPCDLDDEAAVIAVPRGKESDAGAWVRFSASRFIAEGDGYFYSLLDKISLVDLIAIEKALEDAPDDPPIMHEPLGSAVGRLEDDPGTWLPALPPEWGYGYGLPDGGNGRGGAVATPQQPHQGIDPNRWAWPSGPPRQAPTFRSTPRTPDPWPKPNTPPVQQWSEPLRRFFEKLMMELARLPGAPAETVDTFRHSPNCFGWCVGVVHFGPLLVHGCEILMITAKASPEAFAAALDVPVAGELVGGLAAACVASGALSVSVRTGVWALNAGELALEHMSHEDYCHNFCLAPTW